MWQIQNSGMRFIGPVDDIESASTALRTALDGRRLTLIIGNGPSQSAAWLQRRRDLRSRTTFGPPLSWSDVVKAAAVDAGYGEDFVRRCRNYLALAQAVLIESSSRKAGRSNLLKRLRKAFVRPLQANGFDEMLGPIAGHDVVTTNYDFQLERALERRGASSWHALVRSDDGYTQRGGVTFVHKMHGSFRPAAHTLDRYRFSDPIRPERSIVITESDYDSRYRELCALRPRQSGLMSALSRPCLIIGKSLDPQDISFMYALRKTRSESARYALLNTPPSPDDAIHMRNLGITPLIINMPRLRSDGHYYFGTLAALARLFPDRLERIFEEAQADIDADFPALAGGPSVLAIGLAARNLTGVTTYQSEPAPPPPGRRNMGLDKSEEHLGGSALTALLVFSALNEDPSCRASIASAIGTATDPHAQQVLNGCRELSIDTDAVSLNQPETWYSTVLIHNSKTHDGKDYPGQRIFLDRGYKSAVNLDPPEVLQLHAQIGSPDLRVLYADKFLAAQHPTLGVGEMPDPSKFGPLLRGETIAALDIALTRRAEIDFIYETGGGGSPFQHVESRLSRFINVFTSGFPFFARTVLLQLGWGLPELSAFSTNDWVASDFEKETEAVEAVLGKMLGQDGLSARLVRFEPDDAMLWEAGKWAGRESGRGRRWFISTLHHRGAIGIDLHHNVGWLCQGEFDPTQTKNTAGAGDSFRGALMYALIKGTDFGPNALPTALEFATDVATERCRHFLIEEARGAIKTRFAGGYGMYETRAMSWSRGN